MRSSHRAWRAPPSGRGEIARALAPAHDVELVTTAACALRDPDFPCRHADGDALEALAATAEVVVVQGDADAPRPELLTGAASLVVDLYDPFQLEALERTRGDSAEARRASIALGLDVVNEQLRRGDFFLCASERQRDFWIGQLTAVGRVNEAVYDASPDLDALIAVVPFGIPDTAPARTGPGLRGVVPGIAEGDEVVYWGGGIYDWFDPLTLVPAVARLRERRPRLRLVFAGGRASEPVGGGDRDGAPGASARRRARTHRHARVLPRMGRVRRARQLAARRRHRHQHAPRSCRDRVTRSARACSDTFWAGLPVVATAGDALADEVVADRCRDRGRTR